MQQRPSRNHCTTDPPTKIEPSRARDLIADLPYNRGEQTIFRYDRFVAGVHKQEAPRAIRVFDGSPAARTSARRGLPAGRRHPGNRNLMGKIVVGV